MRFQDPWPLLLASLWLAPGPALAAEDATAGSSAASFEEVESCALENLPSNSSVQTVTLTTVDRIGARNTMDAKIYWEKDDEGRSRLLLRFSDPPDMRNSALLMLQRDGGNDLFMYLPALKKTRRVTSRMVGGSMFGTDFSYEEFERLVGMAEDVGGALLPDGRVGDRPVWVVDHSLDPASTSGYERVRSYVDQERCVTLKIEYFEKGERLRKVMEVDPERVAKEGGSWVPRAITMTDLRDETHTDIKVTSIELDAKIHRKIFTQTELEKGH